MRGLARGAAREPARHRNLKAIVDLLAGKLDLALPV